MNISYGSMSEGLVADATPASPGLTQYIMNQVSNASSAIVNNVKSGVQSFMTRANEEFQQWYNMEHSTSVQAFRNQMAAMWQEDAIYAVSSIEQFQVTKPTMQRYLASDVEIMEAALAKDIANWGNTVEQRFISNPEFNPYYVNMNTGLAKKAEDGSVVARSILQKDKDLESLSIFDRHKLKTSLTNLKAIMEEGENDPTDPWNGMMYS